MYSQAGKSYDKTRVVSPYSTRQRFRYYQLEPVTSHKKNPKHYQTFETNLREKHDSFILRHAKEIITNTDHSPNYQTIQPSSPRPVFSKGAFERYIGEIRDEDYSKPLEASCDHRCLRANTLKLDKACSTASSKLSIDLKLKQSQFQTFSKQAQNPESLDSSKKLYLPKKLERSDLKSTEPSLIKDRSKLTLQARPQAIKPRRLKGLSFDSSVGHQYLKEVDDRDAGPEFYNIQQARESIIRKSFKEPSVHVRFASFRNSIATRYDRADPSWHLKMDTSDCRLQDKDMSYDFNDYSARKPNEVKSKYPVRASMNLYKFDVKESLI